MEDRNEGGAGVTREGFPESKKDDLRYYLDSDGHFTERLADHYEPRAPAASEVMAVFVKVGLTWTELPYDTLRAGMVVRVMDRRTKEFVIWQETGTADIAIADVHQNEQGQWAIRTRMPTAQEIADA